MTLTEQRAATRGMTRPIIAFVSAHQEGKVRQICGFVPIAQYGPYRDARANEIGCVENVRYFVTDESDRLARRYIGGEEVEALLGAKL